MRKIVGKHMIKNTVHNAIQLIGADFCSILTPFRKERSSLMHFSNIASICKLTCVIIDERLSIIRELVA